jgi:hypothetical protein
LTKIRKVVHFPEQGRRITILLFSDNVLTVKFNVSWLRSWETSQRRTLACCKVNQIESSLYSLSECSLKCNWIYELGLLPTKP